MNEIEDTTSTPAHDKTARDYVTIRDAQAAKPAMLRATLQAAEQRANEEMAARLEHGQSVPQDTARRLQEADKQYRKALEKNADHLYTLYQSLPLEQKLELYRQAQEIAEINDRERALAKAHMLEDHARAIAAHQAAGVQEPQQPAPQSAPTSPEAIAKWLRAAGIDRLDDTTRQLLNPAPPIVPLGMEPLDLLAANTTTAASTAPHPMREKTSGHTFALGSPAALTVNLPFKWIPGLPTLNQALEYFDRTTHLDLGFTGKGVASRIDHPDGSHDLVYRLDYLGAGVMSNKLNAQFAPLSAKLEEDAAEQPGWQGNSSIFARRLSEQVGAKFSLGVGDDGAKASFAPEVSVQSPSNRLVSTLTGGYQFGKRGPEVRIPAEYVPEVERIANAWPNEKEMKIILDHVGNAIPQKVLPEKIMDAAENAGHTLTELAQSAGTAWESLTAGMTPQQSHTVWTRIQENLQHCGPANCPEIPPDGPALQR